MDLTTLDDSQADFTSAPIGSLRLLAPAGCGKTMCLLARCAKIASLVGPEESKQRFLIVAFTRAAKDELVKRLRTTESLSHLSEVVQVSTLNSWGYQRVKNQLSGSKLLTDGGAKFTAAQNYLRPAWVGHEVLKARVEARATGTRIKKDMLEKIDLLKSLGFRHDKHTELQSFHGHVEWLIDNGLARHIAPLAKDFSKSWKILSDHQTVLPALRTAENWKSLSASAQSAVKEFVDELWENFGAFWVDACTLLWDGALLTLEDQKYHALLALEDAIQVGQRPQGMHRINHILVDEFQDINVLDLNLLRAMKAYHEASMTIIGDDDQAIFEWRGANPGFILDPDRHVGPDHSTHTLAVNYRSPANIVKHSQSLISHNTARVSKDVTPHSRINAEVNLFVTSNLPDSVTDVCDKVEELLDRDPTCTVALLSRKRSQIIPYQIVLAERKVGFWAAEDLSVFLSGAFEDIQRALLLKQNAKLHRDQPWDVANDTIKLVNQLLPYKLNRETADKLAKWILRQNPSTVMDGISALLSYEGSLGSGQKGIDLAEQIGYFLEATTVSSAIKVMSSFRGLEQHYGKSLDDIFFADPPFLYLAAFAEAYEDNFERFIGSLQFARATLAHAYSDEEDDGDATAISARVHLMTALRAKGKEFDHVFVLDCNDGIWPIKHAETNAELESERRLFYVAMTRPRQSLYLTVSPVTGTGPSPYLTEAEFEFATPQRMDELRSQFERAILQE